MKNTPSIEIKEQRKTSIFKEYATPLAILLSGAMIASGIMFQGQLKLNPNLLGNNGSALGTQQAKNPSPTPAPSPTKGGKVDVSASDNPFLGSNDAKVTIIEFSDFQCPYCEAFYKNTFPQIKANYIDTGKVKFVFRNYPLSFHQNAEVSAEASMCANDQSKFWLVHDKLFEAQAEWSNLSATDVKAKFTSYATDLGLDASAFTACLDTEKTRQKVQADLADGSAAGVSGTPSFFINGTMIVGAQPFSAFQTAIDAELK